MGRRPKTKSNAGRVLAVLWLLVASTFAFLASQHVAGVSAFQSSGQYAETVIGQPNFVSTQNKTDSSTLYHPFRVTFDSQGDLWAVDENNNRVVEFKPPFHDGESASVEIGQANFTSASTVVSQSGLAEPVGLAFDSSGNLWVADSPTNRVLEFKAPFSSGMNASLELGQTAGPREFDTRNTSDEANGFTAPVAVAFDKHGDLWVSDRVNNRILEFKPPFTSGMNASSVIGQVNASYVPNYVTTTNASLFGPNGLAFDSKGNLWVADESHNRVLEFPASSLGNNEPAAVLEIGQHSGDSQFSTSIAATNGTGLNNPVDLAFDSQGNLWVSDRSNNRVIEFDAPFSSGMIASAVIGQPSGPNALNENVNGTSQTLFQNPLGIAFDSSGNLWASDQLNNRILEFSGAALSTSATDINVTGGSAPNQASCKEGQAGCQVSANETATGVSVDMTGVASANNVNFYSSTLSLPEENSLLASSPISSPSGVYGVVVNGLGNGTASVCIDNSQVGSSTGIAYYSGGAWSSATDISNHIGVSVCGTLPLSAVAHSDSIIAIGTSSQASSSISTVELVLAATAVVVILVFAYVLVVRKRHRV